MRLLALFLFAIALPAQVFHAETGQPVTFDNPAAPGERLLLAAVDGLAGASELVRDGEAWQWTMTIRDPHAPDSEPDPDNSILALTGSLETLKIVLITGRFESAEGFTLSSDSRVATFDEKTTKAGVESWLLVLRLRWVDAVK